MVDEQQPTEQQHGASGIGPAPTPTDVTWQGVWGHAPDGSPVPMVELTFATSAGLGVYYFPVDLMRHLIAKIGKLCDTVEAEGPPPQRPSGLIVPDVDVSQVLRSLNGDKRPQG